MTQVIADQKDMEFILYEQFNAEKLLSYERYRGFSKKIFDMILSEARKLAIKEILPTLADGDKEGVLFENGKVAVPDSFHRARKVVREADLTSTMEDPDWGGQGLPFLISIAIMEYTTGANYALSGYTHMGHGTGKMIELFGTDGIRGVANTHPMTAETALANSLRCQNIRLRINFL